MADDVAAAADPKADEAKEEDDPDQNHAAGGRPARRGVSESACRWLFFLFRLALDVYKITYELYCIYPRSVYH